MTADCTFVTCDLVPDLDPDDRAVLDRLARRGVTSSVAVWSDPNVDWGQSRLCVIRSTWDYHTRFSEFIAWVDAVSQVTLVRNQPSLLKWNADKTYLLQLRREGVPVVPTVYVERGERAGLDSISGRDGWEEFVIKPARGAASHSVLHVQSQDLRGAETHLSHITRSHGALLQPYLRSVSTYGERGLMFFNGAYSHAVSKKPFDSELAVSDAPDTLVQAASDEIAVAAQALALVPGEPMYARVDLLRGDRGEIYVNEVELVEPGLYLRVHEPAIAAFADAIEAALSSATYG